MAELTPTQREEMLGVVEAVNMDSMEGLVMFHLEVIKMALRGVLPVEIILAVRPMIQDLQATMMSVHQSHGIQDAFRITEQKVAIEMTRTITDVQPSYFVAAETVQELPDDAIVIDAEPNAKEEEAVIRGAG